MKKKISKQKGVEKEILKPRQKYDYTPNNKIFYDVIIVGSGVAGLAAAMYCGRLGMKTLVIGEIMGGTINLTHVVENYPGFISISGQGLAKRFENHAKDYDIDILQGRADEIKIHKDRGLHHFEIFSKNKKFHAKTIIYAVGTKWRQLNVLGEREYLYRGVSYCALCDGVLFRNKIVGVVGGSDSAVKEALLLTKYAKRVYLIYRGEKPHPEPINMKRCEEARKKGKIELINKTNILEIKGNGKFMTHVIFDKIYKGKKELKVDGLFIAIGHTPMSELASGIVVNTNKEGEILINKNSETNVYGFFSAGDVTDTKFKQAITGVGEAIQAAYHAFQYVNKGEYVMPMEDEEI